MKRKNKRILLCYGKTPYTPGRYLEDGIRQIGIQVDIVQKGVDFSRVDLSSHSAVIFIESPSKPPVHVKHIDLVKIPKLFWIHHGENRLKTNLELIERYQPDMILMAHSLQLASHFSKPVKFFPFAMANHIFNCSKPLKQRPLDISFVGSRNTKIYQQRNLLLKSMKAAFYRKYKMSFYSNVYLEKLAKLYCHSKIVFNHSADELKTINMRLFEGMASGALMMTDLVPNQETLFIDKKHCVTFHGKEDLLSKIEYYLKNPVQAQRIATAGYQYMKNNHTYKNRAYELLQYISEVNQSKNSS